MPLNLDKLDKEQFEAVSLPLDSNALVLAGAGSGKTRVLTNRIAYLLEQGVSARSILAVTFTNKASKEMLERLKKMMPDAFKGLTVGTFHGIANRLLRHNLKEADLSEGFQIMDMDDQTEFIKELLNRHFSHLVLGRGEYISEEFSPKNVANWISEKKEKSERAYDLKKEIRTLPPNIQTLLQIYEAYEHECNFQNVVDFSELLLRFCEVLEYNEEVAGDYQRRFRYILIDEFQDINALQFKLIEVLAKGGANVFVVGDDDQSIYGFRGSDVQFLRDFNRIFKPKIVHLGRNYRSTSNIVEVSNALIANNQDRFMVKKLWTENEKGALVQIYRADNAAQETRFVVSRIQKLRQLGVPLSQIAVLYRMHMLSRVFEGEFLSAQINYHIYGGGSFFGREEVKNVLAYLKLLNNSNDNTSFKRVGKMLPWGISENNFVSLNSVSDRSNGLSLFRTASQLPARDKQIFSPFLKFIESLKEFSQNHTLFELTQKIIVDSKLREYYEKKERNPEKLEERLASLDELLNATQNFKAEPFDQTDGELAAFLDYVALFAGERKKGKGKGEAVQMMSVHLSKGLEFDAVFVVGLEEETLPAKRAIQLDEIPEERRVLYVAMTRAKKHLHLSYAQRRQLFNSTATKNPSRFLAEIKNARSDILLDMDGNLNDEDSPNAIVSPKPIGVKQRPIGGGTSAWNVKNTAQTRNGETLALTDYVIHPKFGRGKIISFDEGKGLGFIRLYFEEQCIYKEFDLNVVELRKE